MAWGVRSPNRLWIQLGTFTPGSAESGWLWYPSHSPLCLLWPSAHHRYGHPATWQSIYDDSCAVVAFNTHFISTVDLYSIWFYHDGDTPICKAQAWLCGCHHPWQRHGLPWLCSRCVSFARYWKGSKAANPHHPRDLSIMNQLQSSYPMLCPVFSLCLLANSCLLQGSTRAHQQKYAASKLNQPLHRQVHAGRCMWLVGAEQHAVWSIAV